MNEALKLAQEALEAHAALIQYQFTGSKEAMSALQRASDIGQQALAALAAAAQQQEPAGKYVWKVTYTDGTSCHFGAESIAKASARLTGNIEAIALRDFRLVSNAAPVVPAQQQEPVGKVHFDFVYGWHMQALIDWERIGKGTKLYAAPVAQPVVPEGWKLVPVEPTTDMVEAGIKAIKNAPDLVGVVTEFTSEAYDCYRAMLAVAPSPAQDKDAQDAIDLLDVMYEKYENGANCYEDPDDCSGYIGKAINLNDEEDARICDLLNRLRPTAMKEQGK